MEKPIADVISTTLQKIKEMVDVNTIIGEEIVTADGITIIPVSEVKMGFGTGGSEFGAKVPGNYAAGGTAAVNIKPVAFLIISNGNVKLMPVNQPAGTTIDRLVEHVPEIIEKISTIIKSNFANSDNSAVKETTITTVTIEAKEDEE